MNNSRRKIIVVSPGSSGSTAISKHLKLQGLLATHSHAFPIDGPDLGIPVANPVISPRRDKKRWCQDGPLSNDMIDNSAIVLFLYRDPSIIHGPRINMRHFLNMHSHDTAYIEEFLGMSISEITENAADKSWLLNQGGENLFLKKSAQYIKQGKDPLRLVEFISRWQRKNNINFDLISVKYNCIPDYWDLICQFLNIGSCFDFIPSKRKPDPRRKSLLFSNFSIDKYPDFKIIKGYSK